jgi:hypothetical protein
MGSGDADMRGFIIGSPNVTVYYRLGVRLILDDLARVGCCGGATNVPLVRTGGSGEGAGRPATDTGRDRHASRQRGSRATPCWR